MPQLPGRPDIDQLRRQARELQFAAVQATTKSRVDLGPRLDGLPPAGRLLVARNIASGAINLRIALGGPGEVDEEVASWLRRAYEESVAPPAPRRRATPRRPAGSSR